MNIPKLRADFERLYGRPLTISDAVIVRVVERVRSARLALPAPPLDGIGSAPAFELPESLPADEAGEWPPPRRREYESAPQVRYRSVDTEVTARRSMGLMGAPELGPDLHLVHDLDSDGEPTYSLHYDRER